jgi:hypothetical protein
MLSAGMGLIIVGYALLYAGTSNLSTGGKGWGFMQALGMKSAKGVGVDTQAFFNSAVPTGGATATPPSNASPVSGVQSL